MAQSLDKDTLYDLLDRLNILEHAQLGVERTRPVQTATRLKETLTQEFENYRLPGLTMAAYADLALNNCRRKLEQAKRVQEQRRAAGDLTHDSDADVEFWKTNRKYTLHQDGACYGYDFEALRFNTVDPLAFEGSVDLTEFEKEIEYFSDSEVLSLPGTLRNMLAEAQRRGFNYRSLASLFHQFIVKYFPQQKTSSFHYSRNQDTAGLFGLLCELINPAQELSKIRSARAKLVRQVGMSISTVIEKVKSLNCQELAVVNSGMDAVQIDLKASQLAQTSLRDFVSRPTWQAYESWIYTRLMENKVTSLKDGIRKIDALESENESWRPREALSIKSNKEIDPQSIQRVTNIASTRNKPESKFNRSRTDSPTWRKNDSAKEPGRFQRDSRSRTPENGKPSSFNRDKSSFRNDRRSFGNRRGGNFGRRDGNSRGRPESGSFRDRSRSFTRSRSDSRDRRGGESRNERFSRSRRPWSREGRRDQSRSQDRDRSRSWSLGRRDGPRDSASGRTPASPRSARRRARTPSPSQCYRCLSSQHRANACERYPRMSKEACFHCEKRGIRLFHSSNDCRFRKNSNYRSPSTTPRQSRVNNISESAGEEDLN